MTGSRGANQMVKGVAVAAAARCGSSGGVIGRRNITGFMEFGVRVVSDANFSKFFFATAVLFDVG